MSQTLKLSAVSYTFGLLSIMAPPADHGSSTHKCVVLALFLYSRRWRTWLPPLFNIKKVLCSFLKYFLKNCRFILGNMLIRLALSFVFRLNISPYEMEDRLFAVAFPVVCTFFKIQLI